MSLSARITLPDDYNYIAVFLTFRCQLRCHYCINKINKIQKTGELDGKTWIKIFDKIEARDIPITLQGGEPTLHRDFYYIVNNVKDSIRFDLLTNLQFDIDYFIRNVHPDRFKRNAPYASIRASYHPATMKYEDLLMRTLKLLDKGYQVGIWAVLHPEYDEHINHVKEDALKAGIDFRVKPFLGFHDNKLYGQMQLMAL